MRCHPLSARPQAFTWSSARTGLGTKLRLSHVRVDKPLSFYQPNFWNGAQWKFEHFRKHEQKHGFLGRQEGSELHKREIKGERKARRVEKSAQIYVFCDSFWTTKSNSHRNLIQASLARVRIPKFCKCKEIYSPKFDKTRHFVLG